MILLGINAYHGDSSACLMRDGALVAAAEEERFRRIKHWAGFPSEAVRYCLSEAGAVLSDVDVVAINQDARANLGRKLLFVASRRPEVSMVLERMRNKRKRSSVAAELAHAFPGERLRAEVRHVEHHLAHLGSAYLVSPFERAVAVSVDGFGDFASAAWGLGHGDGIEVEERVFFPHSLGIFYQALTQFLGFHGYGDEYKVMGLAPYGRPAFLAEMRRIVRVDAEGIFTLDLDYFLHHRERVDHEWVDGEPRVGNLYSSRLGELLGSPRGDGEEIAQRHKDVACSVQAMYEEAFFRLLNRLHGRYGSDDLALSGGCAMNSVANGKICQNTPFKRVYVQAAAGDAGGAIGAAAVAWGQSGGARVRMNHAYWGPRYSDAEIDAILGRHWGALDEQNCSFEKYGDEGQLVDEAARALDGGCVVGWFQGRMEWGPRALGNRSIVADPRRADMQDLLNRKIKRRESFRPFAPSILRESVSDWFECDDDVPFMSKVYPVRQEKRGLIPAVTHVDGTGRLQTVSRDSNPRYYRLIEAFDRLTGVPLLLNTSFNENEPVVRSPDEAINCFLRTKMDYLVLGNVIVQRGKKYS